MMRWVMRPETKVSTTSSSMEKMMEMRSSVSSIDSTGPSVHFMTSVAFQGPCRSTSSSMGCSCASPACCFVNPSGCRAKGANRVISGRSPRGAAMRLEGVEASR